MRYFPQISACSKKVGIGTIRSWLGFTHFLTRRMPRVITEMSVRVLAYIMKRAIDLVGTRKIMETIAA
jgi:hypothetical protein